MVLEATRILQDKLVRDVRDVDLGVIFGLGFPPFRGGLLFWADTLGAAKIVELLKPFESLGPPLAPTPLLLEMAERWQEVLRPDENQTALSDAIPPADELQSEQNGTSPSRSGFPQRPGRQQSDSRKFVPCPNVP